METSLQPFGDIENKMLWKPAALRQIEQFEALVDRLGVSAVAVGSHISKSIKLPVVRLILGDATFLLRDNFYDVNICCKLPAAVNLPFAEMFEGIYPAHDWDWYLEQVAKAQSYSWRGWTDEEMDDFRILRVRENINSREIEWVKKPDEKDRWIARLTDPAWYSNDWSSGKISWDGDFGPGISMFIQPHPFAQGISDLVSHEDLNSYHPGTSSFTLAVDYESAEIIIRRVMSNLQRLSRR